MSGTRTSKLRVPSLHCSLYNVLTFFKTTVRLDGDWPPFFRSALSRLYTTQI